MGRYMVSLSPWTWFPERDPYMDFVVAGKTTPSLALIPKPLSLDYGLFIRPFQEATWLAILSMIGLIPIVYFLIYKVYGQVDELTSTKIFEFSFWTFFILVNAFYGGALTMFFASEVSLPFDSINSAIEMVPDWKVAMVTGTEFHFVQEAQQVKLS